MSRVSCSALHTSAGQAARCCRCLGCECHSLRNTRYQDQLVSAALPSWLSIGCLFQTRHSPELAWDSAPLGSGWHSERMRLCGGQASWYCIPRERPWPLRSQRLTGWGLLNALQQTRSRALLRFHQGGKKQAGSSSLPDLPLSLDFLSRDLDSDTRRDGLSRLRKWTRRKGGSKRPLATRTLWPVSSRQQLGAVSQSLPSTASLARAALGGGSLFTFGNGCFTFAAIEEMSLPQEPP